MKTAIILGSGLRQLMNEVRNKTKLYSDEHGFHKAEVISGKLFGKEVVLFTGRRHFYEGYSADEVLSLIRMASDMECSLAIITNAAGGLNPEFEVSDLMVITSFLNMLYRQLPYSGRSKYLNERATEMIRDDGIRHGLGLRFGNYCCSHGPSYESRAETRMLRRIGIDAVGMSTVPEMIEAKRLGMQVIGISCISNMLSENGTFETSHDEVLTACERAYDRFSVLMENLMKKQSSLTDAD